MIIKRQRALLTLCTLCYILEEKERASTMNTVSATEARKEWSFVIDSVMRDKPTKISRTRDELWLSSVEVMKEILAGYSFSAQKFIEPDMSVTLSLNEIDIIEHGKNESDAKLALARAILEYAESFYEDFAYYSRAKNRKGHIPYIFKALLIGDDVQLGDEITCLDGRN